VPTPANESDSIFSFVHELMKETQNKCFTEEEIRGLLADSGNHYLRLYEEDLDRIRLLVIDAKTSKLYLITSYLP
jgi:hypothetical protein